MRFWPPLKHRVIGLVASIAGLALLLFVALTELPRTTWRRRRRKLRPRVIWGPSAILNIKYWSEALRRRGYESTTCVDVPATITSREDWDRVRADFLGQGAFAEAFRSYAALAWTLRNGDVYIRFFDLGFLRFTPLQWLEYPLTRLAGKKIIVLSYGGDIAVAGYLGDFEEVTFRDYPELEGQAELFKRRINHSLRWANLRLRTLTIGFQPTHDAVAMSLLTVDTDRWNNSAPHTDADGRNGPVTVVHAPNHREIKGTHLLERAVTELREEGLDIDLQILERRPNEEVRAAVLRSDVVADQFLGGHGLFAIEGMAAGRPVISNLDTPWLPDEVVEARAKRGSPIVDSSPERLKGDLRRLVESPSLRREIGGAGRNFVLRSHSYDSVGKDLEDLVEHVWGGRLLDERFLPEPGGSWGEPQT